MIYRVGRQDNWRSSLPEKYEDIKQDEVFNEFDEDKYFKDDFMFSDGLGKQNEKVTNENLAKKSTHENIRRKSSTTIKKAAKSKIINKIDSIS